MVFPGREGVNRTFCPSPRQGDLAKGKSAAGVSSRKERRPGDRRSDGSGGPDRDRKLRIREDARAGGRGNVRYPGGSTSTAWKDVGDARQRGDRWRTASASGPRRGRRSKKERRPGDRRSDWSGGPDRDRTDDLRIANAALSQLSYRPTNLQCIGPRPGVNAGPYAGRPPGGGRPGAPAGPYFRVSMMAASTSGPGLTADSGRVPRGSSTRFSTSGRDGFSGLM